MTPLKHKERRGHSGRARPTLKVGGVVFLAALCLAFLAPDRGADMAMAQEKDGKGDRRCHTDPTPDKMDQHPDIHKLGEPETKENCDEDRIANDRERRRIEKYLAEFVREEDIVKTLKLKSGDIVDCVDIYKQPALRRPGMEGHELQFRPGGDPGEMKEEDDRDYKRDGRDYGRDGRDDEKSWHHRKGWHHKKKYRRASEQASEKDVDPGSLRDQSAAQQLYGADGEICPEKTVPIRRYTIDILQNFETLDDFFNKRPPHNVNGPNNLHQYAHAYRTVNNWGAQSILNVWSPYTERSSEFSLSQIWVVRGSGSNRETVEVGWQKYRDLYGDYRPRLFIYFTPDNYGNGGCYNLSCGAFVQISNSVYIGGGFTNVSSHPHPSTAWEFKIRWQKDRNGGHWWLKYGNTWVGYYPRSLFDSNGLRNYGRKVDFGGEIIDEQPGGRHTRTDMGSGHFPGDGFGYAAYQRQIRYITTSNFWGIRPSLTATRTDSDCYDISVKNSSGSWERYFYFGGWGYWAHCR